MPNLTPLFHWQNSLSTNESERLHNKATSTVADSHVHVGDYTIHCHQVRLWWGQTLGEMGMFWGRKERNWGTEEAAMEPGA